MISTIQIPLIQVQNQSHFMPGTCQSALGAWKEKVSAAEKEIAHFTRCGHGHVTKTDMYTVRESNPGLSRGRGVFYH